MPRRSLPFVTNEIYHIYNRSVGRETIFSSRLNLRRVLESVQFYRFPQFISLSHFKRLQDSQKQEYLFRLTKAQSYIDIFAFSFMPNHYHFLIKQLQDDGVLKFISNLQNSYAKYFNTKYDRHGSLFQIQFKAKRIESDEQFIHISRYIHLNHVTAFIIQIEDLLAYPWTSFHHYQDLDNSFINVQPILSFFNKKQIYKDFVSDQVDYQRTLAEIKDLTLE